MDRSLLCFFFTFLFAITADGKVENLKICVVGNPKRAARVTKYCDLLAKSKRSPVSCTFGADRLECLLSVSRRVSDFGIFEAEDLYFSTQWDQSSILVVSEVRGLRDSPFDYGTVALVRKRSNITGLADLRGKTLCHPGEESGSGLLFSQYFEERVAPASCDGSLSIYEDRIKVSSGFFQSACKPGPWVADQAEDARLKGSYPNLCELCDSGTCSNEDKYRGGGGSITCFKDGVGEVLWARYQDVKVHLKFLQDDTDDYYYLCDDGTLMSSTTRDPCLWLAKPWQIVGAHRKSATDVQKVVDMLQDDEHNDWEENLLHVIELYQKYVTNLAVSRTPEDYLRRIPGYLSASVMSEGNCNPRHSVKLCVSTLLEEQKCVRMSKAASSLAIQPAIECVQKKNMTSCLDSVSKKTTDLVVVPPDFLHDATSRFKLKNLLFETGNDINDSYVATAVVKKNSGMKRLEDLRGRKICLTRKNGIGWRSVLNVLREKSFIDSECEGRDGLAKYFGGICLASGNEGDPACCPDLEALESADENVLRCLQNDGCDVAVIDFNTVEQNSDGKGSASWSKDLRVSDFRKICRLEKATECHLMWSYPNYLMTHSDVTSAKRLEMKNVFSQVSKYFGKISTKKNLMMEAFAPFDQVSNVLFRDTSTSLVDSVGWKYSNNYLDAIQVCSNLSCKQIIGLPILLGSLFFNFLFYFDEASYLKL